MNDSKNSMKRVWCLNFIAAGVVCGIFFLFTSGMVVPLHEGGWIEAYLSIPVTLLCILVNLMSGAILLIFGQHAGEKGRRGLRVAGWVVACGSVMGQLGVFFSLYVY